MTTENYRELIQSSIKDLEWQEDYHLAKLEEAKAKLQIFRDKLNSLDNDI